MSDTYPMLNTRGRTHWRWRPRPPYMTWALAWAALAACATGTASRDERREPCLEDSALYSYSDTARGVIPPVLLRSTMPRGGFSRITAQGIVGTRGRVERRSVRAFGGIADERVAVGDALFWTRFSPATRDGCPVRFLYRITYMAGIPQRVPDDLPPP